VGEELSYSSSLIRVSSLSSWARSSLEMPRGQRQVMPSSVRWRNQLDGVWSAGTSSLGYWYFRSFILKRQRRAISTLAWSNAEIGRASSRERGTERGGR